MTHIGRSGKVFVMRVFIAVLILIFSLQSWTKADDIRDFQIEGIGIGDSLLNFMSAEEIKNYDLNYYPPESKFYSISYTGSLEEYSVLEVDVMRNDKDYKIVLIRAGFFIDNLKECKRKQKMIVKDIKNLFNKSEYVEASQKHYYYKHSTQHISQFYLKNTNHRFDNINVECMEYGAQDIEQYDLENNLSVSVQAGSHALWIEGGAK